MGSGTRRGPSPISKKTTAAAALTGNSGGRFDSSVHSPFPFTLFLGLPLLPAPARIPMDKK